MATFNLKIFSPYGVHYEGPAEAITLRTATGDMSVWANHANTVTALDTGKCTVTVDGKKRTAACSRGVLNVAKNEVTVLAARFEWKEDIDLERSMAELEKHKEELKNAKDEKSAIHAKIRIKRDLVRQQVKTEKE